MNNTRQQHSARRPRAYVNILGTTQIHFRNPYVVALWSAIFPGAGHILLNKNIRGFILFIWEIFVNQLSHLNLAIFYSCLGNFAEAGRVLDTRWLLLYTPTYLFAVWDSYRTALDLNNQFVLAEREDAPVQPLIINAAGINYLDKSSPVASVAWSALSPGMGQLGVHRILPAFFLLGWWIATVYFSRVLPAVHYTLLGRFEQAKAVTDPQWLLNIPSIYLFSIYDAYVNTVEGNRLFEWEQAKYLKQNYQSPCFPIPFDITPERNGLMYIVSGFEHTIKLEMAVTALETTGISKESILAVPLEKADGSRRVFDGMHASDSRSTLDLPLILGAVLALFGYIYGFVLSWGPIFWGLIGTAVGIGSGLIIKLLFVWRRTEKKKDEKPDVVLMISCDESRAELVKDILRAHSALGVAKLDLKSRS
jgi:hypothetical protein